jgi:hypothetical protein
MLFHRATTLLRLLKVVLKNKGVLGFLKEIAVYLCTNFLSFRRIVIYTYRNESGNVISPDVVTPRLQQLELMTIPDEISLEKAKREGYSFSFYTNLEADKTKFKHGAVLLGVFVNKEMAYKGWLAFSSEPAFSLAPYLNQIGYNNEIINEESAVNPKFRKMGVFQFVKAYVFSFSKPENKTKVMSSVAKNNVAARKTQEKLGAKITHSGSRIRILYLWDFYHLHKVQS